MAHLLGTDTGYAAWHVFVLVLAVAVGRLQGNWKMIFWRLVKLPYLWSPGTGIFRGIWGAFFGQIFVVETEAFVNVGTTGTGFIPE